MAYLDVPGTAFQEAVISPSTTEDPFKGNVMMDAGAVPETTHEFPERLYPELQLTTAQLE
jgi:hypothetical protein